MHVSSATCLEALYPCGASLSEWQPEVAQSVVGVPSAWQIWQEVRVCPPGVSVVALEWISATLRPASGTVEVALWQPDARQSARSAGITCRASTDACIGAAESTVWHSPWVQDLSQAGTKLSFSVG